MDRISTDEITLFGDEDPSQVNLKKIDFELEQFHKIRGVCRKITIFDGSYCQLSIQNKHNKKLDYRIDLAYLDPRPARVHHIAWKWAYGAFGLAALSASMIWVGWFSDWITPSVYYLIATVVAVSASLICLLLFANSSYDKIVFHSQHGNVRLIELLNKYPDKDTFREFISQFHVRIKSARANKGLTNFWPGN